MIGNDFDFQNQCFVVIFIFKITKMGDFAQLWTLSTIFLLAIIGVSVDLTTHGLKILT